jgi:hypothetical protein
MLEAMKPVSKTEFYKRIYDGKLDVQPHIVNDKWPYASLWTFHNKPGRPIFGKSVGRDERGRHFTDYFLHVP